MYDLFATRYGYSLEQFYALTLRQIFELKRVIEVEKRKEAEFQAKLNKMELKGAPAPVKMSAEDRKLTNDHAEKLHERLLKRHKDFKDGKRSRVVDKNKR